jgi:organic hydroperoxide reductase OsmC/OhrA
MHEFPHHYQVTASAAVAGEIELAAEGLPRLPSASPPQFEGPGDCWSPETLLVGAVADCFVLTFRAVARASNLPWTSLHCNATGTLDRVERVSHFTRFDLVARLIVPEGTNPELARRALEKAERNCLVSNSLRASVHLEAIVEVEVEHAVSSASA